MTRSKRVRANGQGSVYQLANGRWAAAVTLPNTGGKQKVRTAKTEPAANKLRLKMLDDMARGQNLGTDKQTVSQFIEVWLEDVIKPSVKITSYHTYARSLRKWAIPYFEKIKLATATPQHINGFLQHIERADLAPSYRKFLRGQLNHAFRKAYEWGLVSRNPVEFVASPRAVREEIRPFTPDEAQRFLDALAGHRLEAMFALAVILGPRKGELLALRWRDVDIEHNLLFIRGTLSIVDGQKIITETKSRAGKRRLKLPPVLVQKLRQHYERQSFEKRAAGELWQEHDLVFTTAEGLPLSHVTIYYDFLRTVKAAGLPEKRFHDLRHTAASVMIADNVPIKLVSEILGHASIVITLQIYGHLYEDQRDEAVAKLEKRYGQR